MDLAGPAQVTALSDPKPAKCLTIGEPAQFSQQCVFKQKPHLRKKMRLKLTPGTGIIC
jgi:hypothetical protein